MAGPSCLSVVSGEHGPAGLCGGEILFGEVGSGYEEVEKHRRSYVEVDVHACAKHAKELKAIGYRGDLGFVLGNPFLARETGFDHLDPCVAPTVLEQLLVNVDRLLQVFKRKKAIGGDELRLAELPDGVFAENVEIVLK